MDTQIKIFPKAWNGDAISLHVEKKNGNGSVILHYCNNNKTIVLSEIVGITRNKQFNVRNNIVEWISSHGCMQTDGKVILRKSAPD